MDFERMSSNIIDIIGELSKNRKLVNYIAHNGDNPSTQNISFKEIAPSSKGEKVFAYPFDIDFTSDVRTELHIYYPNFEMDNNGHSSKIIINFDIVVHKSIWLVNDGGKKIIRPYQIAKYIIDSLKGKKIGGLGDIHFIGGAHTIANSKFEGLRLSASFTEF